MVHIVICRRASARAVELCPAFLTPGARINIHASKAGRDVHIERLVEYAALLEFLLADKLVAGIDVAVRRDRDATVARAAAAQPA